MRAESVGLRFRSRCDTRRNVPANWCRRSTATKLKNSDKAQELESVANSAVACVYGTSGFGGGFLMQIFAHSSAVRRDRIPQQRHAKGKTVSHAEFIALRRAKAPKLNRRAERCTTIRAKDVLTETA
jgi:hypothetical protein